MMQCREKQINCEERCLQLLMERLRAIRFDYDIQQDIMNLRIAGTLEQEYRIEDYRKKLCTVNRGAVHPDFLDQLLAVYLGQNMAVQEFLLDPSPRPTGKFSWYEVVAQPVFDEDGRVLHTVGILWNIEERKGQMETSFTRFRSERDPVTGILNQSGLEKAVAAYLSAQGTEENGALMLVYLTNFASIAETRGNCWSDPLLVRLCKSIGRLFRAGDLLAHLGSGRFAIFVKDVDMPEIISLKARAIRCLFAEEESEYGSYGLQCKVATAFYPKEGQNYFELFSLASDKLSLEKKSRFHEE